MRALIVAHGQPSEPGPAEAELAALSQAVAALLPGWRVDHATLAAPGALAAAIRGKSGDAGVLDAAVLDVTGGETPCGRPATGLAAPAGFGLVYPLFMAAGWFTQVHLPARLAKVGGGDWIILPPFGTDPGVQDLTVSLAREAVAAGASALLLAAHGSFRSSAPAEIALAMADRIAREVVALARVEAAFIEQEPRLDSVRGFGADAVCLPFFAAAGGHVRDDLPAALAEARFPGQILPPVGLDPRVPALIAAAIRRGCDH